jgi:hypothetical protein
MEFPIHGYRVYCFLIFLTLFSKTDFKEEKEKKGVDRFGERKKRRREGERKNFPGGGDV